MSNSRYAILLLVFTLLSIQCTAQTLSSDQLTSLREAVREMCLLPDRVGDYLKVEGEAKAGLPVALRVIRGDIAGKVSYDTWKGIPITLDKYKTDPRQCALEMMKLLLPSLSPQPSNPAKKLGQSWKPQSFDLIASGRNVGFNVEAYAQGRVAVLPDSMRLSFPRIEISRSKETQDREPKYVHSIRPALACSNPSGWSLMEFGNTLSVATTVSMDRPKLLNNANFVIKNKKDIDISECWFAFELTLGDGKDSPFGTAYAHSPRNVFE